MAKILIADIRQGATRLSHILAAKHTLFYGNTVESVIDLAKHNPIDLIIIGVLFDYSRMFDLVKEAKKTPELEGVTVMGFSDEHTDMTMTSRNMLESTMHIVGASDYVDTRGMSDKEILQRINSCLLEKRTLSGKVDPMAETPLQKRKAQEKSRGNRKVNVHSSSKVES
ncbi:MAG TPA: hypothetical protein V6C76_06695 [Drouetiella sp.]